MLKAITQGKIRNTLLLGLVILIIVPTFIAVGINYYQAKANIEQQVYNSLETVLDKQVYFINNWFWQQRQYALLLSSADQISSMEPQTIQDYLQNIAYTNPVVQDMGVADKEGNVISGTNFHQGLTISDLEYFNKSMQGKTWTSDIIADRFSGKSVLVFSAPIYHDHQIKGVFFSAVSLGSISRLMQNLNIDEWTESYIVNKNATLVTELTSKDLLTSRGAISNSSLGFKINSLSVKEALAGKTGVGKYSNYLNKEVYGVYQPISINKMAIIIEKDAKAVLDRELKQAFFSAINSGIIIALIFLPVAVWLSRMYHQLNQHIRQLEAQREEIQCQNEELAVSQDQLMVVNSKLEQVVITDHLTKVYNRRYLFKEMAVQMKNACQNNTPISLILCDIDHFKKVNDTYGHQVGDQVLVQLTRLIVQNIGAGDLIARFGGEEFVILLPNKNLTQSEEFAEQLREIIEQHIFKTDGGDIKITCSFGVTCFTGEYCSIYGTEQDRLLNVADKLLYQAKRAGRNKVIAQMPTCPRNT